jgi:hypothetical protein
MILPTDCALLVASCLAFCGLAVAAAAPLPANYDEDKVPAYTLLSPLQFDSGKAVTAPAEWPRRRAEILRLLQDQMYGFMPGRPTILRFVTRESGPAFDGKALRKQVRIWFAVEDKGPFIDVLLYLPKADKPAPAFVGLNFNGNHTVHADPAILLTESWVREKNLTGKPAVNRGNRATDESRGTNEEAWQADYLVSRGYALATAYCGDIDPDFDDGFRNGVHALFPEQGPVRAGNAWGTVCAWAWGLSRMMDFLQTDPAIDARHVAVMGHSRLGKTALWAGAMDERFALVISNNSGCGGAALSKRLYGEAIANVAANFPHWFCSNYYRYANQEQELPFDQHELIAAIAPRAVYAASAEEDRWADPTGEFLSLLNAEPVYTLLGVGGFPATERPPVMKPVVGPRMGYHIRTGKHDVLRYDWERYADFADRVFGR